MRSVGKAGQAKGEMQVEKGAEKGMAGNVIKALLIEDSPIDAQQARETLTEARGMKVEWVRRLDDGVARLGRSVFDVILLDLALPDASGFASVQRINQSAPGVPVIVLSGPANDAAARFAIRFGAADYLVKGSFTADLLERSIRYAIDRCAAREELAQARDSALQSARLRSEFLANMSHEIRTPLNGIVGMSRLLTDGRLRREQREMVEIVRQSADTLVKIIADILDFSKLSAGRAILEETDFDLGTMVESVIALFAEQAHQKGLELASYVDGEVPRILHGDAGRLCQVLTNLVGNAIKFTAAGEVTLRVGLVRRTTKGTTLRFAIKDTGMGVPVQGRRQLFQVFGQADAATTRPGGGSGLSLAISAQVVERLMQEHAHAWGIHCDRAASAAETIVALKAAVAAGRPYDLALLEIQGHAPGGLTLARAIKADTALAQTRILGMYALGARPDERRARAAGISATLAKPIRQTQLLEMLSATRAAPGTAAATTHAAPSRRARDRSLESSLPLELRTRTRILLVEDNSLNQRVEMKLLERIGFKADTVNNGQEALAALAQKPYDIVLMDCQMPELDGYSATREIRRRETDGRHTVIIGVTANVMSGDRDECLASGMDDYVSKPIAPEDLAATLEKWVSPTVTP